MPASPYAGYRPRVPQAAPNYPAVDAAGAQAEFARVNPNLFNRPQVTSTFGGRPASMNMQPLRAGSTFNGARVVAGMGGGPGMTSPLPTNSAGPTRNTFTGWAGGQGGAQQAAAASGQPTGNSSAQATGLPAQIQQMFDQANAANKGRYDQLLHNEQQDKGEVLQGLNGWNAVLGQANTDKAGVLQHMNQGWDSVLNLAGQNGIQSDLERERRRAANAQGAASQSLVNRGLTNTTIADSTRRGITDDSALREQGIYDGQKQREIQARENMLSQTVPAEMRLNEGTQQIGMNQLQQLIPTLMRQNENRQGIIERRTDEGPNLALAAQLLQQQGATQQSNQSIAQALQAAQAGANGQYQGLLNSILGQMPGGGGGYGQRQPNGQVSNQGMFRLRRPGGGEQSTGAQNVNGGGYNSNPSGNTPAGQPQQPWDSTPQTTPGGLPMGPDGRPMPAGQSPGFGDVGDLTPEQLQAMGLGDMSGNPMPIDQATWDGYGAPPQDDGSWQGYVQEGTRMPYNWLRSLWG